MSVPEYTSYVVYKNGTKFTNYIDSVYRNTKIIDTIYGKDVSVNGTIISLLIKLYTSEDFCSYSIEVKNAVGYTDYTIKLISASKFNFFLQLVYVLHFLFDVLFCLYEFANENCYSST